MYKKCNKCGWVHFAVSRSFAETEVTNFNQFFDTLTVEEQQDYYSGNRSSIENYEKCFRCGESHKTATTITEFPNDLDRVTLQPMILE